MLDMVEKKEYHCFQTENEKKLTRAGITYILNKYVEKARSEHPELVSDVVSPHGFRHSKSMHMLQAGVPLIYIRDFWAIAKYLQLKSMPGVIANRNVRR